MQLLVHSGLEAGHLYDLTAIRKLAIGRQAGNDLIVPEEQVSRRHAEIEERNGSLIVTDLTSSNGTLVNGVRISTPQVLRAGDTVQIGSVLLQAINIQSGNAAAPISTNYQEAAYSTPNLNTNPTQNLATSANGGYAPPPATPGLYNSYDQTQAVQNYSQPVGGYNQAAIPQNYSQLPVTGAAGGTQQLYGQPVTGSYTQPAPQFYGQSATGAVGGGGGTQQLYGQPVTGATGGYGQAPAGAYGQPGAGGYGQVPVTGGYGQPASTGGATGNYGQPAPQFYNQPAPTDIVPYNKPLAAKRGFPVALVGIGTLILIAIIAVLLVFVVFKDSSTNPVVGDLPAPPGGTPLMVNNSTLAGSIVGVKGDITQVKTGFYSTKETTAAVIAYYQNQMAPKGWVIDTHNNGAGPIRLQLTKADQYAFIFVGTIAQQSDIDTFESEIPALKGQIHIGDTEVVLAQMPKSLVSTP